MATRIAEYVTVSPCTWPEKKLERRPGDLAEWMPDGLGLAPPMIVRPWDNLDSVLSRGNFYGLQHREGDPIYDGPRTGGGGGTLYFDGCASQADLMPALRLMEVRTSERRFAVFLEETLQPERENYLVQLRIVSRFALRIGFEAISDIEFESFPEQPMDLGELIQRFIADQREIYEGEGASDLDGAMGGDGDWARESLAFGFAVENGYQGVYRLWSRAWLVTK